MVFQGRPIKTRDGGLRDDPLSDFVIRDAFYEALRRIGITEELRKERNIVFHSLRHSIVVAARTARVDPWQLQKAVGHSDLKMLDHYADHEIEAAELDAVVAFQEKLFNG